MTRGERDGKTFVERAGAVGIDAARGDLLLPAPAKARTVWSRSAGGARRGLAVPASAAADERFELGADRLARGDALGARDVVTLRVAHEEAIARAAEALPDRFGPALLDRADRLPLGLELSDLGGGLLPVGRLGQRLGLRAERFLLREVLGPDLLRDRGLRGAA